MPPGPVVATIVKTVMMMIDAGDVGGGNDHVGNDEGDGVVAQDRGDYHCNSCPPAQTVSRLATILLLLLPLKLR